MTTESTNPTPERIAVALSGPMRGALATAAATPFGSQPVVGRWSTVRALLNRGLIRSDRRLTALGREVLQAMGVKIMPLDRLHAEAISEDAARQSAAPVSNLVPVHSMDQVGLAECGHAPTGKIVITTTEPGRVTCLDCRRLDDEPELRKTRPARSSTDIEALREAVIEAALQWERENPAKDHWTDCALDLATSRLLVAVSPR